VSAEQIIFDVAEALRVPVLILVLAALVLVVVEVGAFAVELVRRRRRDTAHLESAAVGAREALNEGDLPGAQRLLWPVASSAVMGDTLLEIAQHERSEDRVAKALADFDYRSMRRLERTRLLVRAGPALGLMGTLIPLSPALAGLAEGNVTELSSNLRLAFSITVLGLLIGTVAFGISLIRDRLYGQDFSDLEFVAATLRGGR
jgi:biopolymer transport protein ExbB/TolQ